MKCPHCKRDLKVVNDELIEEDIQPICGVCEEFREVIEVIDIDGGYMMEICYDCLSKLTEKFKC